MPPSTSPIVVFSFLFLSLFFVFSWAQDSSRIKSQPQITLLGRSIFQKKKKKKKVNLPLKWVMLAAEALFPLLVSVGHVWLRNFWALWHVPFSLAHPSCYHWNVAFQRGTFNFFGPVGTYKLVAFKCLRPTTSLVMNANVISQFYSWILPLQTFWFLFRKKRAGGVHCLAAY